MSGQNSAIIAWKHHLQQDLDSIQTIGDFAVQRTHSQFVNPGLEINGSLIPLPLDPLLADRIKDIATPASFSENGTDIVESSPKLIWELHHGQFQVVNPSWSAFFEIIKQDVAHGLGLAPSDIDFKSEKLLLYEKGSFIRRHKAPRGTSKVTGHLVICLPSEHTGGSICVEHAGRHHAFATAPASAFNLSALAWHAGVSQEIMEITSGQRLELTYCIMESSTANSANFLINQHPCLKERIERWPKTQSRIVYPLDHDYSQSTLCSTNLKGRDLAVVETLKSVCSKAGIYLFLGNVTKKEYNQELDDFSDDSDFGFYLKALCTTDGVEVSSLVRISEYHLVPANSYSNHSAVEVDEGVDGENPNKPTCNDSAVVLVPRNKLHRLLEPPTKAGVIMALVTEEQRIHPSDATIQADMLRITSKILESRSPGLEIVESAWCLKDMPLYRRAIRHCAAHEDILNKLPKMLATLVSESSGPGVANWSEGFEQTISFVFQVLQGFRCLSFADLDLHSSLIDLLVCCPDTRRIFTVLSDFEQALGSKNLQDSFRVWVASLKRDTLTSRQCLAKADLEVVQDLATTLWHDKNWIEQRFIYELGRCPNRTLITEVIETLVDKGSDNTLPGAEEAAQKILNKQLRRLNLGDVNLFSVNDQKAASKLHRFIDTIRMCLDSGFMEESLKLIKGIKPDMERQWHCPRQRSVSGGIETGGHALYEPILAHDLVHMLGHLFDVDEVSCVESLRNLFEYLLRKYILTTLSLHPSKRRRSALKNLRGEQFQKILGDSLFKELILLEEQPMDLDHSRQAVAGVKRKAEEELSPSPRSGDSWWVS